jgi:hypothetical protein
MGAKRDRAIIEPVDEGLKAIGIDAGAVAHVIASHYTWTTLATTVSFR